MLISPLPQSTVRLLGSSVTITCPLHLVKELVDNSIDAGATTIEVSISADTISKIQIRDNGQGIIFGDLDSLGRRSHTSKLRSFEELKTKGGNTLGFRGEALASANTLATIKVTTRTVEDPVASQVVLKFGVGGVEKKQPMPAPVGTTVQALKLFENLPVRKQYALKESRKALPKIKRSLQAYALALPHIKLAFKVPDEPNQNWTYSPCSSTIYEAILQVFGASLATQCIRVDTLSKVDCEESKSKSTEFELVAFFPKLSCKPGTIKDKGPFISVDSRPISHVRGTGKKLASIFKKNWNQSTDSAESSKSVSNPFMHLSITCSPGSYDPNVSPMKDELLFVDEQELLDSFEELCKRVYERKRSPQPVKYSHGRLPAQQHGCTTQHATERPAVIARSLEYLDENEKNEVGEDVLMENKAHISVAGCSIVNNVDGQERAPEHTNALHDHGPYSATRYGIETGPDDKKGEAPHNLREEPVEVMMRTISKVNLSRTDSNDSDNSTEGSLPVKVMPWRPKPTPTREKRSHRDKGLLAPAHGVRDIGSYFRPKSDESIEIAVDDTATTGHTPEPEDSLSSANLVSKGNARRPLGELRDCDLNKITETEVDLESSSPEPEILQPYNMLQGNLRSPSMRSNSNVVIDHEPESSDQGFGDFSPHSTPSLPNMLGQRWNHRLHNQYMEPEAGALRTPPSSGPIQSERRLNPPFRLPRINDTAASRIVPLRSGSGRRAQPLQPIEDDPMQMRLSFGLSSPRVLIKSHRREMDREKELSILSAPNSRNDLDADRRLKLRGLIHAPQVQQQG